MKKVSEILREERTKKNISLEEASASTKIKRDFLNDIEKGQLDKLPSKTYALGFVKVYARFLGLSESRIIALFRREYEDEKYHVVPEFRKKQHLFNRKTFFNARNLTIIAVILVLGIYFLFQYNSLFFNPKLAIYFPKDKGTISGNVIEVKGKADQYSSLTIDGEEVLVGLNGEFKKSIFAFSGEKKITVIAKSRFGKETKKIITVTVK